MKLLIADRLPRSHIDMLRKIVEEVEYNPDLTADVLAQHISGVRILVVRGTKVGSGAIERDDELELIVRAGAGTENIDLDAASAHGVYVTSCPDKNSAAVAELTLGLLLAVDRRRWPGHQGEAASRYHRIECLGMVMAPKSSVWACTW